MNKNLNNSSKEFNPPFKQSYGSLIGLGHTSVSPRKVILRRKVPKEDSSPSEKTEDEGGVPEKVSRFDHILH